jgi:hypothetical protein
VENDLELRTAPAEAGSDAVLALLTLSKAMDCRHSGSNLVFFGVRCIEDGFVTVAVLQVGSGSTIDGSVR